MQTTHAKAPHWKSVKKFGWISLCMGEKDGSKYGKKCLSVHMTLEINIIHWLFLRIVNEVPRDTGTLKLYDGFLCSFCELFLVFI